MFSNKKKKKKHNSCKFKEKNNIYSTTKQLPFNH